jgi:hypothetical protein
MRRLDWSGPIRRRIDWPGMIARRQAFLFSALAAVVLFTVFSDLPVFGDAAAYGYSTARWIADHGMTPIPAGDGRGEQAMGHPALYFWLWALLMEVFGDHIWVAHLLPALSTFVAVLGTWRLAEKLAGRAAGLWSAAGLIASPLFLAQCMQPLQDTAFAGFAALSLAAWAGGDRRLAVLWCTLAAICREQALLLAASLLVADLLTRRRDRILGASVFLIPLLVPLVTGLANLAVNGYFFFGSYLGEPAPLQQGWLAGRLRFFAGHLLAGDGRWILMTVAVAASLARFSRSRLPAAAVLMLLAPALLWPPERLLFLAVAGVFIILVILKAGSMPGRTGLAMAFFIASMILFHVLIVAIAPDPQLDLYRYLLGAYPAVLAGGMTLLRRAGGVRLLHNVAAVFVFVTALSGRASSWVQPDSTPAGLVQVAWVREAAEAAASAGDTVIIAPPELPKLLEPGLGYVSSPVACRTILEGELLPAGTDYTVILTNAEHYDPGFVRVLMAAVPPGSYVDTLRTWSAGPFRTTLLGIGGTP